MNATNPTPTILPTQNEGWGFFGTTLLNTECTEAEARDIWDEISCELMWDFGLTSEQTRDYLDSRDGRHLADAMTKGKWIAGPLPAWIQRSIRRFLRHCD